MANAMPRGARLLIQHQWRRRRQRQQFAGVVVGSIIFPSHSHDNRITMMLLILQHHPAHRLEKAIHPIMETVRTGILIHRRRLRRNICIVNNHLLNVKSAIIPMAAAIPLSMKRILMMTTISMWTLRKKMKMILAARPVRRGLTNSCHRIKRIRIKYEVKMEC